MFIEFIAVNTFFKTLRKLGALGLVLLGIADASIIPLPGSIDALTIFLAARHPLNWIFYAASATLGAVFGGYLTYRLGVRGGNRALEGRLSKKNMARVYATYRRYGFGSILVPALLPPPVPFTPFLLVAGAMKCPPGKFLSALTLGRGARFLAVAYLAAFYHRPLTRWLRHYYHPILVAVIFMTLLLAVTAFVLYLRHRHTRHAVQQVDLGESSVAR